MSSEFLEQILNAPREGANLLALSWLFQRVVPLCNGKISDLFFVLSSGIFTFKFVEPRFLSSVRASNEYRTVSTLPGRNQTYAEISLKNLCQVIKELLQDLPNAWETYGIGAFSNRGIFFNKVSFVGHSKLFAISHAL